MSTNTNNLNAECTWGQGPDVLLSVNGQLFDLTTKEAEKLAWKLEMAAHQALELDQLAKQGDKDNVDT